MGGTTTKLTAAVEEYFADLRRVRVSGPASCSGWKPNRIGRRRSCSSVCDGSTQGSSRRASFGLCNAASRTGAGWFLEPWGCRVAVDVHPIRSME